MLNKAILIGRLTRDPELRVTPSGVQVSTFTVAVNRSYVSQSGTREADFLNCVCYRKLAENVGRYCRKGQLISVEGRIQTRSYDAQDGTKRYVTEIVCDNVVFLESGKGQSEQQQPYYQGQPTFSIPQEQPRSSSNSMGNTNSQPDDYFDDNINVNISEDDLPF